MGTALQRWTVYDAAAAALVHAAGSAAQSRLCANSYASLLGLQPNFDVADLSTVARGKERYLVYGLGRGAAVGLFSLGSPEWLIRRALLTLVSGQRFSKWVWMDARLYERESSAPCLPVGIIRDEGALTPPYLDRGTRRRTKHRPTDERQTRLNIA
jgi:hypothetical protein